MASLEMRLDKEDFAGLFKAWRDEVNQIELLFQAKHKSYGPDNISATELKGIVVRLWDKINRLRRCVLENNEEVLSDETLEDTLQDVADYAIIGLLLLHEIWPEFEL